MSVRRPPSRPERNRRISARGVQGNQGSEANQGNQAKRRDAALKRRDAALRPRDAALNPREAGANPHSSGTPRKASDLMPRGKAGSRKPKRPGRGAGGDAQARSARTARSPHSAARSASSPARAGAAYRSETSSRPGAAPRPGTKPRTGGKPWQGGNQRQATINRSDKTSHSGPGGSRGKKAGRKGQRRAIKVESGQRQHTVSLRAVAIALFAILAIIIVTPTVSRFSEQQHELRAVRAELENVQQHTRELEVEKALWNDPDYVRAQARVRLGYVVPGQRLFVGADPNEGTAQEQLEERVATVNRERRANTPWYITGWDSITIAGNSVDGQIDNPDEAPMYTPPTPQPQDATQPAGETPADGSAPAPAEQPAEPPAEEPAPEDAANQAPNTAPAQDTAPAPEGE
ncbi:FtsB family cell division protein [Actinotignum timonense]